MTCYWPETDYFTKVFIFITIEMSIMARFHSIVPNYCIT